MGERGVLTAQPAGLGGSFNTRLKVEAERRAVSMHVCRPTSRFSGALSLYGTVESTHEHRGGL